MREAQRQPEFVAYVYPGWHASDFRPDTDEWTLLDAFEPYFDGHLPPLRPLSGPYDDAQPEVTAWQVELARDAGIDGFLYFMYFGPDGFVLSTPMDNAAAKAQPGFGVAGVWCVRLPHATFPLVGLMALEVPRRREPRRGVDVDTTPLELMTLRDLDDLLGPTDPIWAELLVGPDRGVGSRRRDAIPDGPTLQTVRELMEALAGGDAELAVAIHRRVPTPDLQRVSIGAIDRLAAAIQEHAAADPLAAVTLSELEDILAH
jgi:hypothetical protein